MSLKPTIGSYDYYIEANNTMIWVNTTNNKVSKSCNTFNTIQDYSLTEISGKSYTGTGSLFIYTEENTPPNYGYKLVISENSKES
jgi:hypothetical protein